MVGFGGLNKRRWFIVGLNDKVDPLWSWTSWIVWWLGVHPYSWLTKPFFLTWKASSKWLNTIRSIRRPPNILELAWDSTVYPLWYFRINYKRPDINFRIKWHLSVPQVYGTYLRIFSCNLSQGRIILQQEWIIRIEYWRIVKLNCVQSLRAIRFSNIDDLRLGWCLPRVGIYQVQPWLLVQIKILDQVKMDVLLEVFSEWYIFVFVFVIWTILQLTRVWHYAVITATIAVFHVDVL